MRVGRNPQGPPQGQRLNLQQPQERPAEADAPSRFRPPSGGRGGGSFDGDLPLPEDQVEFYPAEGHAHDGAEGGTQIDHANLTNVTANQHHNQSHVLATNAGLGADHTMSGATAGHVLRASGATSAAFAQLQHSDLGGIGTDDHHAQAHTLLDSTNHTDTTTGSVTAGDIITGDATPKWVRLAKGTQNYVLKAGASILAWGQVAFSELTGSLGSGQHGSLSDGDHTGDLTGNARVDVKAAGTSVAKRRGINFVDTGTVTWSVTDDSGNEEVDITATAVATSSGAPVILGSWAHAGITAFSAGVATGPIPCAWNPGNASPITQDLTAPYTGNLTLITLDIGGDIGGAGHNLTAEVYVDGVASGLTCTITGAGGTETFARGTGTVAVTTSSTISVYLTRTSGTQNRHVVTRVYMVPS